VDVQRIWPSIIYIEPEKVSSATLVPFCGRSQPPLTARIELLLRDGVRQRHAAWSRKGACNDAIPPGDSESQLTGCQDSPPSIVPRRQSQAHKIGP
jgi:hypothetical protein